MKVDTKERYYFTYEVYKQIHIDKKNNKGYQDLGEGENEELLSDGYRGGFFFCVLVLWMREYACMCLSVKILDMNSGDGCTTLWMYLMPLNYT